MKCVLKKCVALLLSLTFVASAAEALAPMRPVEAKKTYKVVLDAGHDEQHIGARYNGLEEEDITYAIAKYCKKYLEDDYDMKVYLARPEEDCPVGGGAEINCL